MTGLVIALAGVVSAVAFLYPHGEAPSLPTPLEGVFPLPGDVVVRQTGVEIDLPVGYQVIFLEVDGVEISRFEIAVTESTGDWRWRPGPNASVAEWTAGDHTVSLRWDRTTGGNPDPGEYTWTFRVG